jgi:hypothetical protein
MTLSAITDYDLGYTLEETAMRLRKYAHRHASIPVFKTERPHEALAVHRPADLYTPSTRS